MRGIPVVVVTVVVLAGFSSAGAGWQIAAGTTSWRQRVFGRMVAS